MENRTTSVPEIWREVDRLLPHREAGSKQNYIRHAVSYFLKGDLTVEERIAKASTLAERHWPELFQ